MLRSRSKKNEEAEKLKVFLHLATEISTEIRSRREPEYIFTAATVGAMGAIIWGAASLECCQKTLEIDLLILCILIIMCSFIAYRVINKIENEHIKYMDLRTEQQKLYSKIAGLAHVGCNDIPKNLRVDKEKTNYDYPCNKKGDGYKNSIQVVETACFFSAVFCFLLFLKCLVTTVLF